MAMLENCKKADLHNIEGTLLCQCGVQMDSIGGLHLVVSADLEYPAQEDCLVEFYDPVMGVLVCRCRLSMPLKLPNHQRSLRCDIVEKIFQNQRRQDLKLSVGLDVKIHVSGQPDDTIQVPKEGYPATMENLSAGGVYLCTNLPLEEGWHLRFDLNEMGGDFPTLTACILRVDVLETAAGRQHYGYGCRFVDLTPQQEFHLRSYIFQEERRRRKM